MEIKKAYVQGSYVLHDVGTAAKAVEEGSLPNEFAGMLRNGG